MKSNYILAYKITYQRRKNLKKKAPPKCRKVFTNQHDVAPLKESNKFLQNQNAYYTEFPSAPF